MALATTADLAARLGRDFTAEELVRAEKILDDVSARVVAYTGQQFEQVANDPVTVRVRDGIVVLPQRPVTAVAGVADMDGNALSFEWDEFDRVRLLTVGLDGFEVHIGWRPVSRVVVTYSHGYAAVPDDVVAVVCQIAGRAFGTPASESGVTQESLGAWSYSQGGAAGAGPLGMLAAEREVLDLYRRPIGNIRIGY